MASDSEESAYSVVKFMVKVRLVEKRAKRTVGSVMVVNVMSQTRIPGRAFAVASNP